MKQQPRYVSTGTVAESHSVKCWPKQVAKAYYHYCSQCCSAFKYEGTFKQHCKIEPACEEKKMLLMCCSCERTFDQKKVLNVHIKRKSCFSRHAKAHIRKHIGTCCTHTIITIEYYHINRSVTFQYIFVLFILQHASLRQ